MVLTTRAATVSLGVLLMVSSCAVTFDIDEPIVLVPDSSWSDDDRATLARAAECWDMQFGVPFTFDIDLARQRIDVSYNTLVCVGAIKGGQYTPPDAIDVCPIQYLQPRAFSYITSQTAHADILFIVLIHELGHAAGILRHGEQTESVMGESLDLIELAAFDQTLEYRRAFTDEDRELFRAAHDSRTGSCEGTTLAVKSQDMGVRQPLACACQLPCENDAFEPNELVATPIDRKDTYNLRLCDADIDKFTFQINAHVSVQATCPIRTVYYDGMQYDSNLLQVDVKVGDRFTVARGGLGPCDYQLFVE